MAYNDFICFDTGLSTLKFLHNIEKFFRKNIDGFFNKTLGNGIQPAEIAKHLVRHMEKERSVGITHVYVPNCYTIYLAPHDFTHLEAYKKTIEDELAGHVQQQAAKNSYIIIGQSKVDIKLDGHLKTGQLRMDSEFREDHKTYDPTTNNSSETRVFDRFHAPVIKPLLIFAGILTVIEGLDIGQKVDVRVHRINIGRREGNELPLTDMNTSRLHSYILFEDGGHVLYDAKSLNGTYVNEHRITYERLKDGDRIKLGNTVLLYKVK